MLAKIDRRSPLGRRDFAVLLSMATYGMGAAEAFGLRLDDIDWVRSTLLVIRPKTRTQTLLPLLPPVGRAILAYLRRGRPRRYTGRQLFISAPAASRVDCHSRCCRSAYAQEVCCRSRGYAANTGCSPPAPHLCQPPGRRWGISRGDQRHHRPQAKHGHLALRTRRDRAPSLGVLAAAMKPRFKSHLSDTLQEFLDFKYSLGHSYHQLNSSFEASIRWAMRRRKAPFRELVRSWFGQEYGTESPHGRDRTECNPRVLPFSLPARSELVRAQSRLGPVGGDPREVPAANLLHRGGPPSCEAGR